MAASRFLCHILGVVSLVLAAVLLVVGLVLEIIYQGSEGNSTVKAVAIALFAVGALLCFTTMIYVCCAAKRDWKLFGCCRIKTKYGDTSTIRRDEFSTGKSSPKSSPRTSTTEGMYLPPPQVGDRGFKDITANGGPPSAADLDLDLDTETGLRSDEITLH